jgi:pyruvate dehydrogenase E2 component (dihydrolipoamide acetyltransferase)
MTTEVLVPPLGQTVDTVTLVTWYKQEGETVVQGEPLFAIETDKATLDVEAPASGVLHGVTAQPGDAVQALRAIAVIGETEPLPQPPPSILGEVRTGAKNLEVGSSIPPPPQPSPPLWAALPSEGEGESGVRARVFISPRAQRLAKEHGVDLAALTASGPEGAIVERDVRAYLAAQSIPAAQAQGPERTATPVARRMAEEAGLDWREVAGSGGPHGRVTRADVARVLESTQPAPPAGEPALPPSPGLNEAAETIPLRSVRAVIAERMARSAATTAPVTLTAEADATALVELRRQLAQDGVDVSYNDLFLYILGRALRDQPQLNASLEGDAIVVWRRIHIGLAVDTERGLLVPVVHDVDRKGLAQIAGETRALVERARAGGCTPDELHGGTFTLTNLGMAGIDAFTPIINLPECAVLGVGRIKLQPALVDDEVVGRHMVWLSLTFDHRLVDGGPAARFLQHVVQFVERPHLLIA